MSYNFKLPFLILLILTILGCQNSEKSQKQLIAKEFGKRETINDSLGVELSLNQFRSWRELLIRTTEIVCNDSVPKIKLQSDTEIKTIYLSNPCWQNYGCILIKEKNVIKLHNDSIGKFYDDLYPIDSLYNILKRDVENNGANPSLSDNPRKLLIFISYNGNRFKNFPETLDKLTQTYERITNKTDINITLDEKVDVPPPPPPPSAFTE